MRNHKEPTKDERLERLSSIFNDLLPKVSMLAHEVRRAESEYAALVGPNALRAVDGMTCAPCDAGIVLDVLMTSPFGNVRTALTDIREKLECAERIGEAFLSMEAFNA